jgi:hypothetical protein
MIDQNNDDEDGMENVLIASLLAWPTLPVCFPSHNDRLSSVVVIATVSTTTHMKVALPRARTCLWGNEKRNRSIQERWERDE